MRYFSQTKLIQFFYYSLVIEGSSLVLISMPNQKQKCQFQNNAHQPSSDYEQLQEDEELFPETGLPSILQNYEDYSVIIDGDFILCQDLSKLLRGVKKFEKQYQRSNLFIYNLKLQEQQEQIYKQIFRAISAFDWRYIQFRNCQMCQQYLKQFDSPQTKIANFYNCNFRQPILNCPNINQIAVANTQIIQGNGLFLKHYEKLTDVFTANQEEATFLKSKINQLKLQVKLNISDIFK